MIRTQISRFVAKILGNKHSDLFAIYNSRPTHPKNRSVSASTLERIIGELASPGIIFLNQNSECVYSSPGWHQLSGSTQHPVSGNEWLNAINSEDKKSVHKGCVNAIKNQQIYQTECRLNSQHRKAGQ